MLLGKNQIHKLILFCGFSTAAEVADVKRKLEKRSEQPIIVCEIPNLLKADVSQQNGIRDNVRIFGVHEDEREDFCQIDAAIRVGCPVLRADFSACHMVPRQGLIMGRGR